ncbi:MAG: PAS domain S-box protein [Bacteroidales bacterium]|nr:PAS domain S-box protein [Bacteroidales bacterium]
MISPDMRTLIFSFLVTDMIITIVMVMLWIQNRKHFFGTIYWVVNFTFQTVALALIAMRGVVPDWMSMVLSNSLVIAGNILGLIGLEYFAGIRRRHILNWMLLAVFIFIHFWFSIVKPDLPVRNLNLATAFLIVGLQVCWLVAFRLKGEMRRLTSSIGFIFLFYCVINTGRIINFFTAEHPGNDYFETNGFESLVLIFYQMLFILLTYSLALMFNKKLLFNMEESSGLLRESQALLQAAMDCSPSGIAIADAPDGKLRYVNKAGLMIPAKEEDEIVEDIDINRYVSSWQIKHHDGTPYKPEEVPLARAVLYGEANSREFIISRGFNDDRVVLANAAPIFNDSGKVKAGIVVFHDITDYKNAEEKLRQQFFTLKGLNDSSQSPIFSVDVNYCYTSFNKTHAAVMKHIYNIDIEVGKNLLDCMSNPDDRKKAKKNIDLALKGQQITEEAFSGEDRLSKLYFEVSHNPILNDKSEVIGVAVLARDMTHRKIIEEELRETSEYLENLINYANAPIIVWDTNLTITRFNHAFESLTGLVASDVINKKIDILFPAETKDESMVNIRNTTLGSRWEIVEIPIKNVDGTVRTVIWNSATIYDKDRVTPIAAIAQGQDITERINTENLLKEKIHELEKFNKIMVGREIRMIELKKEINELCIKLKMPERYKAPKEIISKDSE